MADEAFEEDEPEIEDDVDIEDPDLDLDDADDVAIDVDVDVEVLDEVAVDGAVIEVPKGGKVAAKDGAKDDDTEEEDDDVVDLEEELHPDDVEEPLDVLLAERTAAERLDEDEADLEDDDLEPDAPGDTSGKIVPRSDNEFLCRSCFLVKPLSQLAKGEQDLCRDCE